MDIAKILMRSGLSKQKVLDIESAVLAVKGAGRYIAKFVEEDAHFFSLHVDEVELIKFGDHVTVGPGPVKMLSKILQNPASANPPTLPDHVHLPALRWLSDMVLKSMMGQLRERCNRMGALIKQNFTYRYNLVNAAGAPYPNIHDF